MCVDVKHLLSPCAPKRTICTIYISPQIGGIVRFEGKLPAPSYKTNPSLQCLEQAWNYPIIKLNTPERSNEDLTPDSEGARFEECRLYNHLLV
jgi:hypothetical protein